MKTLFGSWLLLGLAATLPAEAPKPESKIQVLVYNQAGVSTETLARAEREAARIYKHAGIELNWLDCSLAPDGPAQTPACYLPLSPERPVLRVLGGRMGGRQGLPQETFGYALIPADGGLGMVAQVCADCCEKLAKGSQARQAAILGHVMAHELGHLLLNDASHGATGLMHIPWSGKALESVAQGALLFTSEEGERMRRLVVERLRGAAHSSSGLMKAGWDRHDAAAIEQLHLPLR